MANAPTVVPGFYTYDQFTIKSYDGSKEVDIKFLIHTLNFEEGMRYGHIRGYANILDTQNVLGEFPIRGEEAIEFVYRDAFGSVDRLQLHLYAITDVKPNQQGTGVTYKLHFTSKSKFDSEQYRVKKSYRGFVSEIANTVFDEFYSDTDKEITIEETTDYKVLVIPDLTPEGAMHFLSRRAHSTDNLSQTFRFFERRDRYYLATLEFLLEEWNDKVDDAQKYDLFYNAEPDYEGEALLAMMNQVISLENPIYVDSVFDIYEGAYRRRAHELDLINQVFENIDYDYREEKDTYPKLDRSIRQKHTDEFAEAFFNDDTAYREMIFKDYTDDDMAPEGIRFNTHYAEIMQNKGSVTAHLDSSRLRIGVYGRTSLYPGDIVTMTFPEFKTATETRKIDKYTTGRYFVDHISHSFVEDTYIQNLNLVKIDWNGDTAQRRIITDGNFA